jgi:HPt (histidine-containing phosphotransfer) domain-containing protein
MALRIKSGEKIQAYGAASKVFDENSQLSQDILEHLKSRFPDQIEEIKEQKKEPKK